MEADMLDVIFLGAGLVFFALAIGYTLICERLWWAAISFSPPASPWVCSVTWFTPWSVRSGS